PDQGADIHQQGKVERSDADGDFSLHSETLLRAMVMKKGTPIKAVMMPTGTSSDKTRAAVPARSSATGPPGMIRYRAPISARSRKLPPSKAQYGNSQR